MASRSVAPTTPSVRAAVREARWARWYWLLRSCSVGTVMPVLVDPASCDAADAELRAMLGATRHEQGLLET